MPLLTIDYNGTDVERVDGLLTYTLRDVPDFGLYQIEEPRIDQGELGVYPTGIPKPKPRQVAFVVECRVDSSITDPVQRHAQLVRGWRTLARMFSPTVGYNALGVEYVNTAGLTVRRELLCRPLEAPAFRMVYEAGRGNYGARPAGYLRYLVRLEATWPWWRGEEQSLTFDTSVDTVYDLALDTDAQRTSGWRLEIDTITHSADLTTLRLTFDSGGDVFVKPFSTPWSDNQVFDWWHTDPQDWFSYRHDGASPPAVVMWGDDQPASGSNGGRIGLDNTTVTFTPSGGHATGRLYWYEWYEDAL